MSSNERLAAPTGLDVADDAGDRARRLGGPLRRPAHLVGHDREAAAAVAGPRGLDCRVERKEVALTRDLGHRVDDQADGSLLSRARRPRGRRPRPGSRCGPWPP
jgi:hypothetical protein